MFEVFCHGCHAFFSKSVTGSRVDGGYPPAILSRCHAFFHAYTLTSENIFYFPTKKNLEVGGMSEKKRDNVTESL